MSQWVWLEAISHHIYIYMYSIRIYIHIYMYISHYITIAYYSYYSLQLYPPEMNGLWIHQSPSLQLGQCQLWEALLQKVSLVFVLLLAQPEFESPEASCWMLLDAWNQAESTTNQNILRTLATYLITILSVSCLTIGLVVPIFFQLLGKDFAPKPGTSSQLKPISLVELHLHPLQITHISLINQIDPTWNIGGPPTFVVAHRQASAPANHGDQKRLQL